MIKSMDTEQFNEAYDRLTAKQKEALKPFLAGEPEEAIAKSLDITDSMVRRHIANSCRKFGFANKNGEHFRQRQELVELFSRYRPGLVSPEVVKKYLGQLLPMVELESPEGSSALDSPFYVDRPPIESLCYATIEQPGCLIRIKAPKRMGKTLLSAKILAHAEGQGYRKVYLNLNQADFTNLDAFLRWFCLRVGQKLRLPNQLENYWDEHFSTSLMNCTEYFEQYLLAEIHNPLALCLDEVDLLFPYREIAEGFLPLLRSWHEEAKIEDVWKRVRLIVVHSKEVYIPLNINQSPFNVGLPIELPEFTPEQVENLAKLYELDLSVASIEQLMAMVGGHPELVQQAISYLRSHLEIELEPILATAPTEEGIYCNHLRRLWQSLQEYPELVEALKKVVAANSPVRLEATALYKLHSMGLVQLQGNNCSPRCNLYRQYFCDRLGVEE
jgi:DNA-binding CsgD family transcriptional regulator